MDLDDLKTFPGNLYANLNDAIEKRIKKWPQHYATKIKNEIALQDTDKVCLDKFDHESDPKTVQLVWIQEMWMVGEYDAFCLTVAEQSPSKQFLYVQNPFVSNIFPIFQNKHNSRAGQVRW